MRWKGSLNGVAWLVILWSLIGLLVVASIVQHRVPTASLYLDPAATSSARVWSGFFTELGLMAWAVAGTAAACSWAVCWYSGVDRSWALLGFTAAILTALLWLDDRFAMRNWVIPQVLGAPQSAGMVIYLVLVLAWVAWNWRAIASADAAVLTLAGLGLGFSEVIDVALGDEFTTSRTLLEEIPKLLGIVAWALFFVLLFGRGLSRAVQRPQLRTPPRAPRPSLCGGPRASHERRLRAEPFRDRFR